LAGFGPDVKSRKRQKGRARLSGGKTANLPPPPAVSMTSYWQLLQLILPVFALIGIGVTLRRVGWVSAAADESLLNFLVKFLYPCLILDNVLGNPALNVPSNLFLPPLVAFVTMAGGMLLTWALGGLIGLERGAQRQTFAFATGIYNYAYIPIPLVGGLFGREHLGVLLVHNVGCEAAIWTVGILLLAGVSLRRGWRKAVNPPVIALLFAVGLNVLGLGTRVPAVILTVIHLCAQCAIPIGLMLIGATLEGFILEKPLALLDWRVTPAACILRLGVYPLLFLALARALPATPELKRVLVVQASMPAGVLPIVIAKHFGGRPQTAAQVMVATNLLGLIVIPLWLHFGLSWVVP
jgi:malate permease and related proteins